MQREKVVVTTGTHRACPPELTWLRLQPVLDRCGITRVADVTDLDDLGIPCAVGIRPGSETVSVSQGKGATRLLAKISAAIEAAETWHADHQVPPAQAVASASQIRPRYEVTSLADLNKDLLTPDAKLEWIQATRLDGSEDWVPRSYVELAYTRHDPLNPFRSSSNGLAGGNTKTEAMLHALYEIVERDTIYELVNLPLEARVYLNLDHVRDPAVQQMVERLRAAEAWLEAVVVPGRTGIPTFVVYLWSPSFPHVVAGAGTHLDPSVALFRAISEAAQSRLGAIHGATDDAPVRLYEKRDSKSKPVEPADARFVQFADVPNLASGDLITDLATVHRMVTRVAGEPLLVDLTDPLIGFDVVRVVVPGMRFDSRNIAPRQIHKVAGDLS
jgi:ribosomal protein S12 methylthiotransferase accessory factor